MVGTVSHDPRSGDRSDQGRLGNVTRHVSEEYAWISSLTLRVTNNPA
jgi:hypothetical protein